MNDPGTPKGTGPPRRPEVRKVVRRQRHVTGDSSAGEKRSGFRGWHERGYVPHRDEPGLAQFVTFRLADSFPSALRDEWERLLKIEDDRKRRIELEAWLDLGKGECWLRDQRVAGVVAERLRSMEGAIAWTLMPNHVHLLFRTGDQPMAKDLQRLKGSTSREANRILGREGRPFWQKDYWDTFMRDREHIETTIRYIRGNPVKAGLVNAWKDWPWTFVRDDV